MIPAQSCPDLGRVPLSLEALHFLGAGSVVPFHAEQEEEISTCWTSTSQDPNSRERTAYSGICKSCSPSLGKLIALNEAHSVAVTPEEPRQAVM